MNQKIKESFNTKWVMYPLIALAIVIIYIIFTNLPTEEEVSSYEIPETKIETKVEFKIVDPYNYPYGDAIKGMLDFHSIPYYEPLVKEYSHAFSNYILRHMATTYVPDTNYLNISQKEYDLYYSYNDAGKVYRDSIAKSIIKYVGE